MNNDHRTAMVNGLRAAADFLETLDPTVPIPSPSQGEMSVFYGMIPDVGGRFHSIDSKEGIVLIASRIGRCDKIFTETMFTLSKDFGGGVKINWVAYRDTVCEKVQVGTRVFPAEPAKEAVPAREVPIYEYKCPSLLAALPRGGSVEMLETLELPTPSDDLPF